MATVTNQTTFLAALTARDPEIILANNITLATFASITYAVTIKGETDDISLIWGNPSTSNYSMLVVNANGVLTLESIILDAENRNGTLVQVTGGTLIMNEGVIVRNVYSRTANSGIYIGSDTGAAGGTFVMNGGLVTGIDSADAVLCQGGAVIMNNDASVSGNNAAGVNILVSADGSRRGSLTMTGNARVAGNRSMQAGAGVVIYESDFYMGVNEGDAPQIIDNRPPTGHFGGGVVLSDHSTLTMRHNAKITGNFTDFTGGGVLAQDTEIIMRDNAAIEDNVCADATGGGGLRLLSNATLTMEDHARVSGNTSVGLGGGLYLQSGSALIMKGNASIHENEALNGGGIYMTGASAKVVLGDGDSNPQIHDNIATENGGGLFINTLGEAELTGQVCFKNNEAEKGNGIYKLGELAISQSAQVLDGLYFDDLSVLGKTGNTAARKISPVALRLAAKRGTKSARLLLSATRLSAQAAAPLAAQSAAQLATKSTAQAATQSAAQAATHAASYAANVSQAQQQDPSYTDNVPVVADHFTEKAAIVLESSPYISASNVSLVIADKHPDCEPLVEPDCVPWVLPSDFGPEHSVVINEACDQVLITYKVYSIYYCHLFGACNPNPTTYSAGSDFPIVLQAPGERDCYTFLGWFDCEGRRVKRIPAGTRGDIRLIALWEKRKPLFLCFDGNASCVTQVPEPIYAQPHSCVTIPPTKPKKAGYCFKGWNTCPNGMGVMYAPCDRIYIMNNSITLYAQWRSLYCQDPVYYSKRDCYNWR